MNIANPWPGQKAHLQALWQEAFGDPMAFIDGFFATAYAPSRCMCIWEGEAVLAAAHWLDCSFDGGKLAYIYAVATAKAHRGRGLCHGLMEKIHNQLKSQGYAGAILVPGEESLGAFYGGMGYRFFGGKEEFSTKAGRAPVLLRQISGAEYAQLRRNHLPRGGVVHSSENMRFLESYAYFAAGDHFLLAYTLEDGRLICHELLGDSRQAPAILAALGAREGRFRTPGEKPYAMLLPFEDTATPSYFGLAFD